MSLQLCVMCMLKVLTVNGFNVLSINNGYKGVVEKFHSVAIQSRALKAEQWIEQKLDHFDKSENRTWKMRYFENFEFWEPNGPIYLLINGETPATKDFLSTGVLYELAKETGGAMFLSEHRYYGKSQPLDRSNFNVKDMKFLSAAQALADNAKLLRTIKDNAQYKDSKVVVVGGSYAGNLAAWMKRVYPDLIDAAISSSGPVLAVRAFYEYLDVVSADFVKYGTPDCFQQMKNQFQAFEKLFETEDGIKKLMREQNICNTTNITNPDNKHLFFLLKATSYMNNAQYGSVDIIERSCAKLDEIEDLSDQSDIKYYWNDEDTCYDYDFDKMVQEYYEPENDDMLCWTYQTCTEFGYFQSTYSNKEQFTSNIPVEWYDKFCTVLFGDGFGKDRVIEGVRKTNEMFGGKSPNVTEVVFVNGELDPWSSLGITEGGSSEASVVYIPRSSHCSDLFSNEDGDDEALKTARLRIKNQIKKWIGVRDDCVDGCV